MTSRSIGGSRIPPSLRNAINVQLEDDLIVTPPLKRFLVQNRNITIDWKVAKKIARVMSTPQRDRRFAWSASAAGTCLRRQELGFLGVPTPYNIDPQLAQIFYNGTWVHLRWQATLMQAGILDAIEVVAKKPSLRARCSMDGMGTALEGRHQGEPFGFELKGRNDYAYGKQERSGVDEKTRRQVDFEFALSGFERFVILNENKNTQMWKEWVFLRNEERVKVALQEIRSLNRAVDRGKLHSMLPECRLRTGEFDSCPFGGIGGPCEMSGSWPNLGRKK